MLGNSSILYRGRGCTGRICKAKPSSTRSVIRAFHDTLSPSGWQTEQTCVFLSPYFEIIYYLKFIGLALLEISVRIFFSLLLLFPSTFPFLLSLFQIEVAFLPLSEMKKTCFIFLDTLCSCQVNGCFLNKKCVSAT